MKGCLGNFPASQHRRKAMHWNVVLITFQLLWYMSCHLSHVTCHMSKKNYILIIFSSFFCKKIGQSVGASRWRVCYQWGLPRLVFLRKETKEEEEKNSKGVPVQIFISLLFLSWIFMRGDPFESEIIKLLLKGSCPISSHNWHQSMDMMANQNPVSHTT